MGKALNFGSHCGISFRDETQLRNGKMAAVYLVKSTKLLSKISYFSKVAPKTRNVFDYNVNELLMRTLAKFWQELILLSQLSGSLLKKGCFYTVLGTFQKTFVTSCTYTSTVNTLQGGGVVIESK